MSLPMAVEGDTVGFTSFTTGDPSYNQTLSPLFVLTPAEHRGVLNEDGSVQSPSSLQFLHILSLELLRARAFAYVAISMQEVDFDRQETRLEFLQHELARLIQYPALFPSEIVRGRFLALLAADAELCFVDACKSLLIEHELDEWDKSWQPVTRPHYDPKIGWENFLSNKAPGTGMKPVQTDPKTSFQVVTGVGAKIIADFEREEKNLLNWIDTQPDFDFPPARTTLKINFQPTIAPKKKQAQVKLKRQANLDVFRPPPFHDWMKPQHDYTRPGSQSIYDFATFTRQLEGLRAQPLLISRNSWAAIFLRTWRSSSKKKREELKYLEDEM